LNQSQNAERGPDLGLRMTHSPLTVLPSQSVWILSVLLMKIQDSHRLVIGHRSIEILFDVMMCLLIADAFTNIIIICRKSLDYDARPFKILKVSCDSTHSRTMMVMLTTCLLVAFVCLQKVDGLSQSPASRRSFFSSVGGSAAAAVALVGLPTASADAQALSSRDDLLSAITANRPETEIIDIIVNLKDPANGRAAANADASLDGQWELIWSVRADAFSPLLKLPKPFKPESYQYIGAAAASEVGEGRLSQGLTGGILGTKQLWLSSGAIVDSADPSTLLILPPFRLELGGRVGTQEPKQTLGESGSYFLPRPGDAENADFQKNQYQNRYQQVYLENSGKGSLRISTITSGDPTIVGAMFVHQKL
jgi:hypothetical protein